MKNLKSRKIYFKEAVDDSDLIPIKGEWEPLKKENRFLLSEVKELCKLAFEAGEKGFLIFEQWWNDQHINENILPRPFKKVKCLECGEEVCDNMNYKIGHLYNKHNCKPSLNDYKAIDMMKKYFPSS